MAANLDQDQPWWASARGYAAIVVLLSLPRLIVAFRMGLLSDEAYYALWSMHPGPGYYDHSPGIAWAVAAGRAVFGEGLLAVRGVTLLAGFAGFALIYRIGTLLFADARAGAFAGYFYAVSVGAVLSFSIATPDGISTLFWLAAIWAVAEGEHRRNASWWLAAGAFAGLGLLSKYTNVFLAPGLLLYLLADRTRRTAFLRWQLWAGAALAIAMFLPVIWWNAGHDWISFRFQLARSSVSGHGGITSPIPFLYYWIALALIMLPPAFLLMLSALPSWLRRPGGRAALDLPVLTSLPMVLFFAAHSLVNTANPNWLDPVFPSFALVAGYAAVWVRPRAALLRWSLAALRWLQIPLGMALIVFLASGILIGELPGFGMRGILSYGRGWHGLAAKLSDMADKTGARWVDTNTYLVEGLVAYAMISNGDPLPVLQPNEPFRYTYAPPPATDLLAAPHLVLRETSAEQPPPLPGKHQSVTPLGIVQREDDGNVLGRYAVYLVRN